MQLGRARGLSEEDESRINVGEGVNDGCGGGADASIRQTEVHMPRPQLHQQPQHQHRQQQQQVLQLHPPPPPPCPVVRWERFLPVRSLKVLLVENDDSTWQVVSALLRNCSYEGECQQRITTHGVLEEQTLHMGVTKTAPSQKVGFFLCSRR